jgi:hypothetical protein
MLDKPQIIQTEAQQAAIIRITIPRSEIKASWARYRRG